MGGAYGDKSLLLDTATARALVWVETIHNKHHLVTLSTVRCLLIVAPSPLEGGLLVVHNLLHQYWLYNL